MGIPYLTTFIYSHLLSNTNQRKSVKLDNANVIIDGYSLFYFVYNQIEKEKKDKPIDEEYFIYENFSKDLENILKELKQRCANVIVVFDGICQSKQYRRDDPKRDSSVQFSNGQSQLPSLFHDQLITILRQLEIPVRTAPGEADPFIVRMAIERQAFIIARDSDYFLYQTIKGYVPLDTLDLSTLQGEYFHMRDVFPDMTRESVALWATTITYNFIDLHSLKKQFQINESFDLQQFSQWIENSSSDENKHLRLTCQYHLLRYIQQFGFQKTFNQIRSLIHDDDQLNIFDKFLSNYTNTSLTIEQLTPNRNSIHPYLNQLYLNGKLDSNVINILLRRQILFHWNGASLLHLRLLTPMSFILIQWDNTQLNEQNSSFVVTFNQQELNLLDLIQCSDVPTLDQFIKFNQKERKGFLLSSINFALPVEEQFSWNDIHRDYKLPFSLFKLYWNTKTEHPHTSKMTLLAIIISFLKSSFLDTYGETKERSSINKTFPDKPYKLCPIDTFKCFISHNECSDLRGNIKRYATNQPKNNEIERELKEFEQFYKELSMINQFCEEPFVIYPPNFYFCHFTYPLAVHLSQSKHFWKDINQISSDNQIFLGFIQQFYQFIVND